MITLSAIPKLYTDSALTQELAKDGNGNYLLTIGSDKGLDGNNGETATQQLWLANEGDEIYQSVVVSESGDTPNRVFYSLDNTTYDGNTITLGDIAVGANQTFYTQVRVEANATADRYNVSITLTGESI